MSLDFRSLEVKQNNSLASGTVLVSREDLVAGCLRVSRDEDAAATIAVALESSDSQI